MGVLGKTILISIQWYKRQIDSITDLKNLLIKPDYRNHKLFDFNRYQLNRENVNETSISPWVTKTFSVEERTEALRKAISWILYSLEISNDDGSGSFNIIKGWTLGGYPETTGYIIPSLLDYAKLNGDKQAIDAAVRMGKWLVSIQKPSGGWQSGYAHDDKKEVVFNTGQIIRGLVPLYKKTGNEIFKNSAVKAADWLCEIQNPKGYWEKFSYLNMIRVYDSYVAHPILLTNDISPKKKYIECARKNIYWIIDNKQHENGWFEDCDNTLANNNSPILHAISYTIDGILECGYYLNDDKMINAGKKAADILFHKFNKQKFLFDKFDENWNSKSKYINLTGCAQIAIIWERIFEKLGDASYLNAALKMNDFLIFTQQRFIGESINTLGAIAGSFPIWDYYQTNTFPNWATKYFIDSLLLELKLIDQLRNQK